MANTTLYDVWNSVSNAASTAMGIADKWLKQEADASLRAQQLDLESWQRDEMLKFKGRTDYENFQKEYDEDFQRKFEQYNSGTSKYKNNYTAQQGNILFDNLRANGNANVQNMVWQGQRNLATQTDLNSLNLLGETAGSQENYDAMASIINTMYSENRIDEAQRTKLLTDSYTQNAQAEYNAAAASFIAQNPNATDAQINDALENFQSGINADFEGDDLFLDRESVKSAAIKQMWQNINTTRSENNTQLVNENTDILNRVYNNPSNIAQNISMLQAQIRKIDGYANTALSAQDKRTRENELKSALASLENASQATSSGSREASSKTMTLQQFAKTMTGSEDFYNEGIAQGLTAYEIQAAFTYDVNDKLDNNLAVIQQTYIDKYGNEWRDYYSRDYGEYIKPLFSAVIDEFAKDPEIAAMLKTGTQTYLNMVKAGGGQVSDIETQELNAYLKDTLCSAVINDVKKSTDEKIAFVEKATTDFLQARTLDSLSYISPEGKYYNQTIDREFQLKAGLRQLNNPAVIWTNGDSADMNDARSSYGVAENLLTNPVAQAVKTDLTNVLILNYGVTAGKSYLTVVPQMNEDGSDIDAIPNYAITGTGTDLDGKIARYVIDDKNNIKVEVRPANMTWSEAAKYGKVTEITRPGDMKKNADSAKTNIQTQAQRAFRETAAPKATYETTQAMAERRKQQYGVSDAQYDALVKQYTYDDITNWDMVYKAMEDFDRSRY